MPARAIHCELLFDGEEPRRDAVVEITGERVAAVRVAAGGPPPGATSVPFAMPGLVDAQARCVAGDGAVAGSPAPAAAPTGDPLAAWLGLCLYAGVTSVRDVGSPLGTRERARRLAEPAPRLWSAGPPLGGPAPQWSCTRVVTSPAAARREVGALAAAGADLVSATHGLDEPTLRAVVEAAARYGLPVAFESRTVPAATAGRLGVASVANLAGCLAGEVGAAADPTALLAAWAGMGPDAGPCRDLAGALAEHGTVVVPTLVCARRAALLDEVLNEPLLDWMVAVMPYHRHLLRMRNPMARRFGQRAMARYSPWRDPSREERRAIAGGYERLGELLRLLHEAGVPIAAGSGTPAPSIVPGAGLHRELAALVDAGLPAVAALRAATAGAAGLLGDDGRRAVGRVAPGALADLVLLDANPLDDLRNLRAVREVLLGGEPVGHQALRARLDDALAAAS